MCAPLSSEIASPDRLTDQIDNQAPGRNASNLIDIMFGRDFHDIHANDAALAH
jgi:hypothetical protein